MFRINTTTVFVCLLLGAMLTGCKKDMNEDMPPPSASLLLVNAVAGTGILRTSFTGDEPGYFRYAMSIEYMLHSYIANFLNSYVGNHRLKLYHHPDTTAKDLPLFDLNIELTSGSIQTLYLTGTVDEPDTVFRKEEIPYFALNDSAMAIRFINLSKGSDPVTMNLQGEAPGSAAGSCAYKQISAFKKYPVTMSIPQYVFEIRHAVTGELVTTLTIPSVNQRPNNKFVYRSFTVALAGTPGASGKLAPSAFLIGHTDVY